MKKLLVHYAGWGEDFHLATLAESGRDLLFEYTDAARSRRLEISPFRFALSTTGTVSRNSRGRDALVGFINDALPDGWGMRLMDKALEARGYRAAEATPLDRLAIVGDTAFGALRFMPAFEASQPRDLDLMRLAFETQKVIEGQTTDLLPELLRTGSPQGARPKAAVWYQPDSGRMSTVEFDASRPWLVKFPAGTEHPEVCAIEHLYARLAAQCRIPIPETFAIELRKLRSGAFGVARFDRSGPDRVPMQSFAAMLDVDFAGTHTSYESLLMLTRRVTRDQREVEALFRRCVFNVVYNNRDDHLKNFAFQLDRDDTWRLTPAYDLTFSEGPGGEHWTVVKGEGQTITRAHLLGLADSAAIKAKRAAEIIEDVIRPVGDWKQMAAETFVTKRTRTKIEDTIQSNAAACRAG